MTTTSLTDVIYLHSHDNVCVAARNLDRGTEISVHGRIVKLGAATRMGHKIATVGIAKEQPIRKYGQVIGFATQEIKEGDWVHVHNVSTGDIVLEYAKATETPAAPKPIADRTFMGYRRGNGTAGTRNYIAIISTVNCSASVSKFVARHFNESKLKDYPNVDGVVAFTHSGGCGIQFNGLKHQMLNRTMGGIARHPNIGAFLVIGLGCETVSIGHLLDQQQLVQIDGIVDNQPQSPPVFSMQDQGGTMKTVATAIEKVNELLPLANDVEREPIPASELILATECGGSDGNSGITANPAVGVATDMLVACNGTSILSETVEIYGAEHLLTRRAVSVEVADKLLRRIDWWKSYAKMWDDELDSNPSVGNKEGGLTTIAEKSLGAVAKGGSTALVDVYEYAEPVTSKGFVVMDTPGFDPPSVTGMVAGGANVVVFTTGRGSCFGCKPSPSIKIATNSPMYHRMSEDMDINAGKVLEGVSVEEVGEEIFDEILAVASGKKTKSEIHGIGDEEFVPWTVGPTF